MVFIQSNRYRKDLRRYNRNIVIQLPYSSNSSLEVAHYAVKALEIIFKEGYKYKKAGVVVMDLVPDTHRQLSLFENSDLRHVVSLMKAIDILNNRYGT